MTGGRGWRSFVGRVPAALLASLLAVGAIVAAAPPEQAGAAEGPVVSVGDQSGLERDLVTGSVFVPVQLSEPASEPVVVSFATADGQAVAGVDYVRWGTPSAPRTVTIPAGAVFSTVNVSILTDDLVEDDESFTVELLAVTGADATLGDSTGTATIVDADGLAGPVPVVTVSSGAVHEGDAGAQRAQFQLHLSRVPASTLTVSYRTIDGSGVAGSTYVAKLPGTVVFAPGQISKTVDVLVLPDDVAAADRTFGLEVSVVGGAAVEETAMTGSVTVIDDDGTAPPAPASPMISAGQDHSCAVLAGGSLRCWGDDTDGQLGAGPAALRTSALVAGTGSEAFATAPDLAQVVSLGAGNAHTCAALADGTARCWGSNSSGQLGDGSIVRSTTPVVVVGLSGAASIAAGGRHSCAALADGTARCWGENASGQLGTGVITDSLVPASVVGLTDAVQVAGGRDHSCAVVQDGTVRCWGANGSGQLGDGTTTSSRVPVTVAGLTGAVGVVAGTAHSCAVLGDGSVRCWGTNSVSQLGAPSSSYSSVPVAVAGVADVESLSSSFDHTCAVSTSGSATCWGENFHGQLGRGFTSVQGTPAAVQGLGLVVAVATGSAHTCALGVDGSARCWGSNWVGQLDNGTSTQQVLSPSPVSGLTATSSLSAGTMSCATLADGTARCWGSNRFGQLGNGTFSDSNVPVAVTGLSGAIDIDTGAAHTCAVLGSGAARCWGEGSAGQLGAGNLDSSVPVAVFGLSGAVRVSVGVDHSCALLGTGTVRCWGVNTNGQLGNGTTTPPFFPVATVTGLSGVVALDSGYQFSCAVRDTGTVSCWGNDAWGKLGNGAAGSSSVPVAVTGITNATDVTVGTDHACASLADGSVRCWGSNSDGQLGHGSTTSRAEDPVEVTGVSTAQSVAAGHAHSCALLADGVLRCWGDNIRGALGNGADTTDSNVPTAVVGLTDVTGVTAGDATTCATLAGGEARCWGANQWGGVGDGGGFSSVPTLVLGT